jgi:hypothetical protein
MFLEAGEVDFVQWCGGDVNDLVQSWWMGWTRWGGFDAGHFFF